MPLESPQMVPSTSSTNSTKVVEKTSAAPDAPICWYFRHGECHFGRRCKSRHERDGPIVRPSFNTTKVTSGQVHLVAKIPQSTGPTNWQPRSQFPGLADSPPSIIRAPSVVYGAATSLAGADQQRVSDGVNQAMATADAARRRMENPTYHTVLNRLNMVRTRLNRAAIDLRLNEHLDTIPFYQDWVAPTNIASAIAASPRDKQQRWRNEFNKAQSDLSVATLLLESLDMPTSLASNDLVVKQAQQKVNDAAKILDLLVRTHAGLVANVYRAQPSHGQELALVGTRASSQQDSIRTKTNFDAASVVSPEIKSIAKVAATLIDEVIARQSPLLEPGADVRAGQCTSRVNEIKTRRQYRKHCAPREQFPSHAAR